MVFSCYIINFDQFENVSSQCWWVFFILPRPEQKGINDSLSLTLTVCNSHTHTQTVTLWQGFPKVNISCLVHSPIGKPKHPLLHLDLISRSTASHRLKDDQQKTNSHPAYTLNLSTSNKVRLGASEGCPNISHFVDLSIFMSIHFIQIKTPDQLGLIMTLFLITWINKNKYIPDFLTKSHQFWQQKHETSYYHLQQDVVG